MKLIALSATPEPTPISASTPAGTFSDARAAEAAETWWDPFLSARHLGRLHLDERRRFSPFTAPGADFPVIVTNLIDTAIRRFQFAGARLGERLVEISLNRGEASADPALRPGEAVHVSWFAGGTWWGACGHVRMAGRSAAHLALPTTCWSFEVRAGLYDDVMRVSRLFPGFDPTLTALNGLHAVNHPLRVNDAFSAAQAGRRPVLLYLQPADLFLTARFCEAERRPNGALARDSLVFELRSSDLDAGAWRPGTVLTFSAAINGQIMAFRSRVIEGRERLLRCERPAAYVRWDRRTSPRWPMGAVTGYDLFVPLHSNVDGLSTVRVPALLDVSAGGMRFAMSAADAGDLDLRSHVATLRVDGRRDLDLPMSFLGTSALPGDLVAVSVAFDALEPMAEDEIGRLCARLAGVSRTGVLV